MTGNTLRDRIVSFLAAHSTLALASVDAAGFPAAAAVFYAEDEALNLFFLSEERTQHGRNLAHNPEVAGAIQADGQDWRSIQGLQLLGRAGLVRPAELAHAASVYGRKYTFVGALLGGSPGSGSLVGPLARARFFVLQPHWFRLIDNRLGFGHKEELRLGADATEDQLGRVR